MPQPFFGRLVTNARSLGRATTPAATRRFATESDERKRLRAGLLEPLDPVDCGLTIPQQQPPATRPAGWWELPRAAGKIAVHRRRRDPHKPRETGYIYEIIVVSRRGDAFASIARDIE